MARKSTWTAARSPRIGCWRRFAWLRSGYDEAMRGLAGLTLASPAPWTTDRPAHVGRPRIFTNRAIRIDWTVAPPDRT